MKKRVLSLLMAMMVSSTLLTGCGLGGIILNSMLSESDSSNSNNKNEIELNDEEIYKLLENKTFYCFMGATADGTEVTFDSTGKEFSGSFRESGSFSIYGYSDSVPGIYYNQFDGTLGDMEKIDEYTYKATIDDFNLELMVGAQSLDAESIKAGGADGVMETGYPVGFENPIEIYIYLPGKKVIELNDDSELEDPRFASIFNSDEETIDETMIAVKNDAYTLASGYEIDERKVLFY